MCSKQSYRHWINKNCTIFVVLRKHVGMTRQCHKHRPTHGTVSNSNTCAAPGGVRTTLLENHKAKGFLSNTGPDPLKNHNANKPAFNMSHHRLASETPLQWHFAGVKMSGLDCIDSWYYLRWSGSKHFDTLLVFLKYFFSKKMNFKLKISRQQNAWNIYPTCKELNPLTVR